MPSDPVHEEAARAARSRHPVDLDALAGEVLANLRTAMVVLDRSLRVLTVNRAFRTSFMLDHDDLAGRRFDELGDGRFAIPRLQALLSHVAAQPAEIVNVELVHDFEKVGMRALLLNAWRLARSNHDDEVIVLQLEDITERRRAHEALATAWARAEQTISARNEVLVETERRLSTVLSNLPGVAYRCANDPHWTMLIINEGCLELTGYAPEDFTSQRVNYGSLIHPDDRPLIWEATQAALDERRPVQIDYRIHTKDGQEKWVWEQGVGVWTADGKLVAIEGIVIDVTERRRAEEQRRSMEQQMRASQRMEAVGRLAGGVAHDFNNLLTVIQSYADFVLDSLPADSPTRDDVQAVLDATGRATSLTRQLLTFSRHQVQELRTVKLNTLVTDLDKMFSRLIGENIRLITHLSPDLTPVRADVTQIEQVIMNLVVNARDAMPNGGRLVIETANTMVEADGLAGNGEVVPPGAYAMLAVSDNGLGMDAETRNRIFEPFFTTKEKGKGTGLGLSTVYGIVKQSGGFVWVYSEPGRGSTFKVYLPAAEVSAEAVDVAPAEPAELRGTETILLVEDEEPVRKAAARILAQHGYRVLEAASGKDALRIGQAHPDGIHLLLTDIVLPELGGRGLAELMSRAHRKMRVVYTSGYSDSAIVRFDVLDVGMIFLQKPFTKRTLLRKVRSALDGPPAQF